MSRFERAMAQIDAAHAQDPNLTHTAASGVATPYELHYAQKMSGYLAQHTPAASETLQLAVRAQHFRRWERPRDAYPRTRPGYLSWRAAAKKAQAEQVAEICTACGYAADEVLRVAGCVRKDGLGAGADGAEDDREVQVLEDVACLVFLEDQFAAFEKEHDEEKVVRILRKTWRKMSKRGREMALAMELDGRAKELVGKALQEVQEEET